MRMNLKVSIGALSLAALASCGGAAPRRQMSDGERLYLARCTSCHRTYEPGEFTPAGWAKEVAKMERLKKVTLDPGERALLLGWLAGPQAQAEPVLSASPQGSGATSAR